MDELIDDLSSSRRPQHVVGVQCRVVLARAFTTGVAGVVGDGTAETTGSSEGGTVGDPSVPVGRADSDSSAASTTDTAQGSGVDPPAVLSRRAAHELSDYWGQSSRDDTRQVLGSEPTPRG